MSAYLQMFFQLYYYCSRVTYINCNKKFCIASPEAVVQRCSEKKLLLKLCPEFTGKHQCQSLFNKVAGLQTYNFIKKRCQQRCFPVNFVKFLGTPILKNIHEQLLLHLKYYTPVNNAAKAVAKYSKTATARVKKFCNKSPRGISRMFFSLYTGVAPAICFYYLRLMVLWNRVECQRSNETNISLSQFKNATKNNI